MKFNVRNVLLIFGGVVLVFALFLHYGVSSSSKASSQVVDSSPSFPINYSNFEPVMSTNPLIKEIPHDSPVLLKFYNFNSGVRVWENSYVLSNEGVVGGSLDDPKLIITLDSKYLSVLNNQNFCSVITAANRNSDLGIESSVSKTSLAWTYKSLVKYRSCLGL